MSALQAKDWHLCISFLSSPAFKLAVFRDVHSIVMTVESRIPTQIYFLFLGWAFQLNNPGRSSVCLVFLAKTFTRTCLPCLATCARCAVASTVSLLFAFTRHSVNLLFCAHLLWKLAVEGLLCSEVVHMSSSSTVLDKHEIRIKIRAYYYNVLFKTFRNFFERWPRAGREQMSSGYDLVNLEFRC